MHTQEKSIFPIQHQHFLKYSSVHAAVTCKRYFENSGDTQNYWCEKVYPGLPTLNLQDFTKGPTCRERAALSFWHHTLLIS